MMDEHVNAYLSSGILFSKNRDITRIVDPLQKSVEEARKFIDNSFQNGTLKTTGTDIDKIMPPVYRFGGENRATKKQGVIDKLMKFFEKYFRLI